jgi:hypothetical protein
VVNNMSWIPADLTETTTAPVFFGWAGMWSLALAHQQMLRA